MVVTSVSWEDKEGNGEGFSLSQNFNNFENLILLGKRDPDFVCGLDVKSKRFKLSKHEEKRPLNLSMADRFNGNQGNQPEEVRLKNLSMVTSPLPLGLSLRKNMSFAELIEAKLCQEANNIHPTKMVKELGVSRPKKEVEKLKASSWSGKLLRIGSWERHASRDQDLVAKCYYQKKKLVWEMLDGKLKRKMEIQWSDITAIRAAFPKHSNSLLEIEVKTVPLFFRETPPQPRKQSSWITSSDFTGVQATQCRVHHLQFEEGILQPYYEKLLRCDNYLFMLSQQAFPLNTTPFFHPNISGSQNYSSQFNRCHHQPRIAPKMQVSQHDIKGPSWLPSHQAQMYQQRVYPLNPAYISLPLSVMPRTEDHGGHCNVEPQRNFIRDGMANRENHHVENEYQPRTMVAPSCNSLLNDIANQLLNVPISSSCPDEQKLKARVNSMCNLLAISQEQAPVINVGTSDSEYSHSTGNEEEMLMSRVYSVGKLLQLSQEHGMSDFDYSHSTNHSTLSTVESNESEGSMPQQSDNWLSDMGERNESFSDLFQALSDVGTEGSAMA